MSDKIVPAPAVPPPPWADLAAYRARHRLQCPIPPLEQVVADLAGRRQWLMWQYEPGETPDKKPRKIPYYANGKKRIGTQGSPADRAALANYDQVAAAAREGGFDGVGFAFLPSDGLIGIDLDGMIEPESGAISDRCVGIIDACASYTEYSPSGKGVHIICRGETKTNKSNAIGVEVFAGRQYFTFTGRPWPGSPNAVREIDDKTLRRLHKTVDEAKKPRAGSPSTGAAPPSSAVVGGRQRSLAESVALVEEALALVTPDEYQQWIDVGMACKADLSSAGYYVWDAWSARSPKYAGTDDTRKRWDGFAPTSITLGTVFSLAEAAGWVPPWTKARARALRKPRPPPDVQPAPTPASEEHFAKAPAGDVENADRAKNTGSAPDDHAAGNPSQPPDHDWELGLLRKKGEVSPCLANVDLILSRMPVWRGVIGYDEFAERTVFRRRLPIGWDSGETGDWSDHLDATTAIWMQRSWGVEFSPGTVGQAVEVVSRSARFHPVREALLALPPWDGTRRNSEWLSDYLGVERTEYTALVGLFFLRGMIRRVMQPGCKFDYCPVLEGPQGKGKSAVARILGWHWFCDTDLDLSNKDSLLALPGHWVYEIPELGGLMKAEERKQKSFLSRQEDEYRPPYGKRTVKVPRQNVFIGTTNEEEYLKDATGGRRFWPVRCGDTFDLEALTGAREQMYAEALHDYRNGERSWPNAEEQDRLFTPEQAARGMTEPFEDLLWAWASKRVMPFSMADAAIEGLHLAVKDLSPAIVTRIGIALKKIGCGRREDRNASDPGRRRLYLSPELKKQDMRGPAPSDKSSAESANVVSSVLPEAGRAPF